MLILLTKLVRSGASDPPTPVPIAIDPEIITAVEPDKLPGYEQCVRVQVGEGMFHAEGTVEGIFEKVNACYGSGPTE